MTDRVDECDWVTGWASLSGGRGYMPEAAGEAWSVPRKSPTIRTTMPTPSSAIRWCSPKMLWKGLDWRRTDAGQDPLELHDVLFDVTDNSNESLIVLPGWI